MNAYCYILFSPSLDKFYIGFTHEAIDVRIEKHNNGFYSGAFTAVVNDWKLFFYIECESINQALNIERHIKKMKSRQYIINLKKYPEIAQRLLQKFKGT